MSGDDAAPEAAGVRAAPWGTAGTAMTKKQDKNEDQDNNTHITFLHAQPNFKQ